jgi:hypothetical protein
VRTAPEHHPRRIVGLWLILGGICVALFGLVLGQNVSKGLALVGVGAIAVLLGIGQLIWPQFPLNAPSSEPVTLKVFWRLAPLFWKFWLVFSLVAGNVVTLAILILR